jgi:hypothetical protein
MYFLRYIKRIKPKNPVRYPLVTGVAFHDLVDEMYKTLNFDISFLVQNWKQYFIRHLEKEAAGFSSTKGHEKQLMYGYGLVKKFHKFAKINGYLIPAIKSEWAYDFKFGISKLVGKVDLIIQRVGKPFVEIIDFKTGFTVASDEVVKDSVQLTTYDWAVKKELKLKNVKVGLLYPRHNKVIYAERTPEDHKKMLIGFNDLYKSIINKDFKPNLSNCHQCEFKDLCDFHKKNNSKIKDSLLP